MDSLEPPGFVATSDESETPAAGADALGPPSSGPGAVEAPVTVDDSGEASSRGADSVEAHASEGVLVPEAGVVGTPADADAAETPASGADSEGSPSPETDVTEPPASEATPDESPDPDAAPQEPEDDGRFKVVLDNFEGPFDLLLQLISKHKLDVTEVALSRVTDEFMAHIHAMGPEWDLDQATEFLVVAATLLDLKAARLLPTAEVEDEADLALLEARDLLFARLLQYRAYKEIAGIFAERLAAEARRFPRTVGLEPHHAELLPEVVLSIGPEGFARLAVKAMQPKPKPEVYVEHIHAPLVSVREQAQVVVGRLRELGEASFRTLVDDADDTLTVVARFLALLELYRERAVGLEQLEALGELTVSWTGGEGTDLRVTDEFDRAPEQPEEQPA
nr:segregation/condensation protein A [Streptomyces sulphureus]